MKKWYLTCGGILALLGLFVIIFPKFWINLIVILLGLGAIAYGVYCLKFTKVLSDISYYKRTILVKGILSFVIGGCAVIFPLAIGKTMWNIMIWVLIIYLVASAVLGFYAVALLKDSDIDRKRYILENLGLLAAAVVLILISPATLGIVIIRIVGAVAIIGGLGVLAYGLMMKDNSPIVASAEIKEDEPVDGEDSE